MKDAFIDILLHTLCLEISTLRFVVDTKDNKFDVNGLHYPDVVFCGSLFALIPELEGDFVIGNTTYLWNVLNCPEFKNHLAITVERGIINGISYPNLLRFPNEDNTFSTSIKLKSSFEFNLPIQTSGQYHWPIDFEPTDLLIKHIIYACKLNKKRTFIKIKNVQNDLILQIWVDQFQDRPESTIKLNKNVNVDVEFKGYLNMNMLKQALITEGSKRIRVNETMIWVKVTSNFADYNYYFESLDV